ncbi:uncharacterized protein LOC114416928 [Glycine soja]|uniref:uncharacterized protein LOC114416928 n=1 Tax=Glycine soja TaxID=3848 RepID=UPI00103CA70F|nr:uncharacterized protein LOC114416928 [Glycine soja]
MFDIVHTYLLLSTGTSLLSYSLHECLSSRAHQIHCCLQLCTDLRPHSMLTRMSLRFLYSYHRQWYPNYPTYVLFKYKGEEHFIKLHKYGNRYFFGDELKGLRRTHDIYKSVIMHFVAWDKNTTFHVEVMGPLYRRTRERFYYQRL